MTFEFCPLCRQAASVGSHWDWVFELLEDWVKHRPPAGELEVEPGSGKEGDEKNG